MYLEGVVKLDQYDKKNAKQQTYYVQVFHCIRILIKTSTFLK